MFALRFRPSKLGLCLFFTCLCLCLPGTTSHGRGQWWRQTHRMVVVPEEDRFKPFALTIRSGDAVEWVNMDTDDHTIVSDDFFNTAGNNGTDVLLKGTEGNGGQPGKFTLQFNRPGTFVYYCRFHAHLDEEHQPVAPGPDGGIQSDFTGQFGSVTGNYGTAMMGVITVMAREGDER
jgi:plastocyanin